MSHSTNGRAAPDEDGSTSTNGSGSTRTVTKSSSSSGESRVVARYDYVSQNGKRRAQKVRKEPKQFYWRYQAADGNWIRARKMPFEVRLYKRRELRQAIRDGAPVYIADGEKDVESLRAQGFVATCCPHGSENWREEDSAYFQGGEEVIVVHDDDSEHPKPEHRWHGYDGAVKTKNSIAQAIGGDRVRMAAPATMT